MEESQPRTMSTAAAFMSRMEGDVQARRREKFINELSARTHTNSHAATMSACGTHRPLPPPAHREAPELQTEHAGAAQAQVQGREPGGWADYQGALEEEHRPGDEASVSMGPARRLLLMALLPATLHKVLGEGDSNTLLNERRWWSGAHVCASGSRAADPRRASRWWLHLGHVRAMCKIVCLGVHCVKS